MTLPIVSRAAWGARPWQDGVNRVAMSEKIAFLVHYHGGEPRHSRGVAVPREVEGIHLANGWSGVGYNFLVDLDGVIYEGRGWDGVGSQCPGFNRSGIGVYVAIGGNQKPTAAALASVRALYDEGCRRTGHALRKMGHKDGYATSCPGVHLYAWVKAGMPSGLSGGGASAPINLPTSPPAPRPSSPSRLAVDGSMGPATVRKLQSVMKAKGYNIEVDGVISRPSMLVTALQTYLNSKKVGDERNRRLATDGKGLGSNASGKRYPAAGTTHTVYALQRYLKVSRDGYLSGGNSTAVRALQTRLNAGTF